MYCALMRTCLPETKQCVFAELSGATAKNEFSVVCHVTWANRMAKRSADGYDSVNVHL